MTPSGVEEPPIRFVTHLTLAIYLIESGLVLVVAPWTAWWQRNYFADAVPWLGAVMAAPSLRALIVGTGAVTVVAGMSDLWAAISARIGQRNARRADRSGSASP